MLLSNMYIVVVETFPLILTALKSYLPGSVKVFLYVFSASILEVKYVVGSKSFIGLIGFGLLYIYLFFVVYI